MPENAESNNRKRQPVLRIVLILFICCALAAAYYTWHYYQYRESTDDAQIDGHIVPIASRVVGTVLEVKVEDNQVIAAGTILLQIDPRDYQVALAREGVLVRIDDPVSGGPGLGGIRIVGQDAHPEAPQDLRDRAAARTRSTGLSLPRGTSRAWPTSMEP